LLRGYEGLPIFLASSAALVRLGNMAGTE